MYLSIAIDVDNINVFLFIETLKAVLLLQTSQAIVVQDQAWALQLLSIHNYYNLVNWIRKVSNLLKEKILSYPLLEENFGIGSNRPPVDVRN